MCMNRLNGWWRLWLVWGVLSGAVLGWIGSTNIPKIPFVLIEIHNAKVGPLFMERQAIKEGKSTARTEKQVQNDIDELQASLKSVVNMYKRERLEHILTYVSYWIISCLAVLVLYWTTQWIIRGFRSKVVQ